MAGNKDRQRRIARERYRRQQELRYATRRKTQRLALTVMTVVAAAGLIAGLLLAFLPSSPKKAAASATKSPTPSATASASTVAEPAHHCTYSNATPVAKKVSLPPSAPDYTASYTATIKSNLGDISFNLLNSKATCTVNSFVHLAEAGYFNNTQCHRLLTTGIYVLQCGDAYATGGATLNCGSTSKVGSGTPGYQFASENLTGATYPAGEVAMANNGSATTNGSQFFIVYKNSTGLSANYTPFATVSSGLNIVQNVAKDGFSCQYPSSEGGGVPKEKFVIDSVTIKKS